MENPFDETKRAVHAAELQLRAVDQVATTMACLLAGRLRNVNDRYTLKALKHELRNFDATTMKWKEPR